MTLIVEVREDHGKAAPGDLLCDSGGLGHVREGSVSIVVVKESLGTLVLVRGAGNGHGLHFAGAGGTGRRTISLIVELRKIRDIQVKEAIVVDVAKGRAHAPLGKGPVRVGYARRFRNIRESAVAIVAVQPIGAIVRHVKVQIAVVVVVTHRHSAAPGRVPEMSLGRDVGKSAVAVVVE